MGYYLIQIYIPAGLIVIISWVSFWLHRNATPARVALDVTTVLTMTTLMSSTNSALPKISYVKSIDVYLGTFFIMVFASLLEYATVGYLGKKRKARNQQMVKMAQEHRQRCVAAAAAAEGSESCPPPEAVLLPGNAEVTMVKSAVRGQPEGRQKMVEPPHPNKPVENPANGAPDLDAIFGKKADSLFGVSPSDIDKYSRAVFPVFFVCFNLMYWIIYLHISDTINEEFVSLGRRPSIAKYARGTNTTYGTNRRKSVLYRILFLHKFSLTRTSSSYCLERVVLAKTCWILSLTPHLPKSTSFAVTELIKAIVLCIIGQSLV